MSNKTETIESLKRTLHLLETSLIDDDKLFDRELFREGLNALSIISNQNIFELKENVYSLLNFWEENIRSEAVATLGFNTRLFLPEFRDKAYEIFLDDPDVGVKRTALSAWAGYYHNEPNERVLTILYKILKDEKNNIRIRTQACGNIFSTAKGNCPEYYRYAGSDSLLNSKTPDEFNSKIDWSAIEKIMKEFAPRALL